MDPLPDGHPTLLDVPQLIKPGKAAKLKDRATDSSDDKIDRDDAEKQTHENLNQLKELQRKFYADGRYAVWVCLQAMDAGGKDSTIRRVFGRINPQGCRVTSFKVPTELERSHDYLWRHHLACPAAGMIGIHNRSHYETVLIERVKKLAPEKVWRRRYEQINQFESMIASEGTAIMKLYLHLSKDEQKERLLDRQQRPDKHWKFNPADLEERARWNDYQQAFEDALTKSSTEAAPWYAIPADQKWYRDYLISGMMVKMLENLDLKYPNPPAGIEEYVIK